MPLIAVATVQSSNTPSTANCKWRNWKIPTTRKIRQRCIYIIYSNKTFWAKTSGRGQSIMQIYIIYTSKQFWAKNSTRGQSICKNILTLGRKRNTIPPSRYKGGGGWCNPPPPLSFWYVAAFWNDFAFSGKPLIFSTRWGIFYGWWHCWRSVTSPNMLADILDFFKT